MLALADTDRVVMCFEMLHSFWFNALQSSEERQIHGVNQVTKD
jgi:hypothetical protein